MRSGWVKAGLLGGIVGGILVVGLLWFVLQAVAVGGPGKQVIVTVNSGDSLSTIAAELHSAGVINSPLAFRADLVIFGAPTVLPGPYEIAQNSSFAHVKSILSNGPNVQEVTVRPGLTLHEVALQVASAVGNTYAEAFLKDATAAAAASPYHPNGSLEGLIGAGQYVITPTMTPSQLLARMESSFNSLASAVGLSPTTTVEGLSAYQIVIAASIVEKEGYYPRNMPKVARVIFNRLARGGPLQMDATVLYALGRDGGTVTHAMLQTPSPYNTYLNSGLTPTPICTVSSDSLDAVLHAPPGPWLYFTVIDKSGTEAFATTFAQQLANEKIAASRGIG
ncbi:MAG: endolytic transglycosylase MltG [Acidimicrobiales bacterium]